MRKLMLLLLLFVSVKVFSQNLVLKVTGLEGKNDLSWNIGNTIYCKMDKSSDFYNHGHFEIMEDKLPLMSVNFFYTKNTNFETEFFFFTNDTDSHLWKLSFDEKIGKYSLSNNISRYQLELSIEKDNGLITPWMDESVANKLINTYFKNSESYFLDLNPFGTSSLQRGIFDELTFVEWGFLLIDKEENTIDFYSESGKLKKSIKSKFMTVSGGVLVIDCEYKNITEKWIVELKGDRGSLETSSGLKTDLLRLSLKDNLPKYKFTRLSNDTVAPEIKLFRPKIERDLVIKSKNKKTVVEGYLEDLSEVKYLTINGLEIQVVKNKFLSVVDVLGNDLKITAIDKWGNISYREWEIAQENNNEELPPVNLDNVGNYFALIIGVNNYADKRIPKLDNPIRDGKALKNILVNGYTFESSNITTLENPDRKDIFKALQDIKSLVGKNDNFLLFYAGHGFFDREMDSGYWLPTDSEKDNKSEWISFDDVLNHIRSIGSKHTLVISDACFSGGFLKERNVELSDKAMQDLYQVPSRRVITSGNLTTVPDESVFMKYLLKSLTENKDKYFTEENLFDKIKIPVLNNSETTPLIGVLSRTGDEGGNFIFIKR
jgi:hypothetical protein